MPDGVAGSAVTCTIYGHGLLSGESAAVSGPFQVGTSSTWYFEVRLVNAMIVPGEYSVFRRRVELRFSQPSGTFSFANDPSGADSTTTLATAAQIPVYDTSTSPWTLLGGFEPASAGYVQWRRAHFNNALEHAGQIVLIAERVGGSSGAVSASVSLTPGTADAADYTAPAGAAALLSWADGESGEKTLAIPLVDDSAAEGREHFTATLGNLAGGVASGNLLAARVSIEDNDYVDVTAPVWTTGWPKVSSALSTGFTVRARIDEAGLASYVVVADGAAAPSVAQVRAGQDASGAAALRAGTLALAAHAEATANVTGLAVSTAYDVYIVAEDGVPNVQAVVVKLDAQTTPTSYTWAIDANGNWNAPASWGLAAFFPNETGAVVTLGPVITAGRTVTLNTDATLGSLTFNEDTLGANAYTVAFNANTTLTFDAASGNASINARGSGGYALGTPGQGRIQLTDTIAVSAGSAQVATSDSGTVALNSQVTGPGGLVLSSLDSNDGSGTAVTGARGTSLRSTVANTFEGGVTVNSGFLLLAGHAGNLGSGPLTLHASDSTNGGVGTHFNLRTGGGTIANEISFASPGATGGTNPRLQIQLSDSATQAYTFTGPLKGDLGNQGLRFQTFNASSINTGSSLTLAGDGSGLAVGSAQVRLRSGSLILAHAHAFGTGNTVGTSSAGGWLLGNSSNGSGGTTRLLTQGHDVGGRILTDQTTTLGQFTHDQLVLGGTHGSGTASFTGNITLGRIVSGGRHLHLTSAAGGTTLVAGVIADASASGSAATVVPVLKTGAGAVALSGNNTYAGATTVLSGTLLANNPTGSATGSGPVRVGVVGSTGTITVSTTTQTGSTTNASTALTGLTDTSGLAIGMAVTGTGIASGTTIAAIPSGTSVTLSANATATGSATFTFGGQLTGNPRITGLASTAGLEIGQTVTGSGIPAGTLLVGILPGSGSVPGAILLSQLPTSTLASTSLSFANPAGPAVLGGTGRLAGAVTLTSGAGLSFHLSTAPASHDKLELGSTLAFGGSNTLTITAAGAAPTPGTYTLLTAGGTISGSTPALSLPSGWSGSLAQSGGDLVLSVTATTPRQAGRQQHFATWQDTGNAADSADPDADGLNNLLEYALDADPNAPSASAAPVVSVAEGRLTLSFFRARSELVYEVQASPDLSTWTVIATDPGTVGQTVTVSDTVPLSEQARRFLRLRVRVP